MRRSTGVLAGAPFRTALFALAVFVPVLLATGVMLHRSLGAAMTGELEAQISAELVLFEQILERGGETALIEAVRRMEQPAVAGPRLTALFDEDGRPLAGNLSVAPDYVGWRTLSVTRRADERAAADGERADGRVDGRAAVAQEGYEYRTRTERWRHSTIVVGRSTRLIERTLSSLLWYLAFAGTLVTGVCLSIGYVASRRTRDKLARMADTLERVAGGETTARLPLGAGNDQIDRVARQMNEHLDRLGVLMGSLRNTAGSIAHDLRTPLHRASLRLQEVLAEEAAPRTRDLVEDAVRELDTLGSIVETILRIARIEASEEGRELQPLSAARLVAEIGEVFEPVAEEAGHRLEFAPLTDPVPRLEGDEKMLRQMLANLIENAIAHCPPGARIRLGAGRATGGGAVLFVEDDGPGIPAEARERVLEPFFRLDASRATRGTGLGLALVDAVVRRHRARLALEDAGPGLRVVIEFPEPGRAGAGARPEPGHGRGELVTEDKFAAGKRQDRIR